MVKAKKKPFNKKDLTVIGILIILLFAVKGGTSLFAVVQEQHNIVLGTPGVHSLEDGWARELIPAKEYGLFPTFSTTIDRDRVETGVGISRWSIADLPGEIVSFDQADLCYYIANNIDQVDVGWSVSAYQILNYDWVEGDGSYPVGGTCEGNEFCWNNMPVPGEYNPVADETKVFTSPPSEGWVCWDVRQTVSYTYFGGGSEFSILFFPHSEFGDFDGTGSQSFVTKDGPLQGRVDVPFLNITYTIEYEEGGEICDNGIDDDGDELVDCDDPDCIGDPACEQGATELLCNDFVDNDGDEAYDCFDTDCEGNPVCDDYVINIFYIYFDEMDGNYMSTIANAVSAASSKVEGYTDKGFVANIRAVQIDSTGHTFNGWDGPNTPANYSRILSELAFDSPIDEEWNSVKQTWLVFDEFNTSWPVSRNLNYVPLHKYQAFIETPEFLEYGLVKENIGHYGTHCGDDPDQSDPYYPNCFIRQPWTVPNLTNMCGCQGWVESEHNMYLFDFVVAQAGGYKEVYCDNGVDEDGNGFTDCDDSLCSGAPECVEGGPDPVEICDNEVDDDEDELVDCDDPDCSEFEGCVESPPPSGGGGGGGSSVFVENVFDDTVVVNETGEGPDMEKALEYAVAGAVAGSAFGFGSIPGAVIGGLIGLAG